MTYLFLADAVLLLHLGFILFVVAGALLVGVRRAWLPVHLLALAWGVGIEASGATCPLTWLENRLHGLAGGAGYGGGCVEHYLAAAIYPAGLTREIQYLLGAAVLLVNVGLYAWIWRHRSSH